MVLIFLSFTTGCSRFKLKHEQHDKVYVWTRQMYLRDRVAAVSNRVAQVTNGEPLEVLEQNRRFYRVKTPQNEIGWIPERAVIDAKTYDAFQQLADQHKADAVIATGTLRDDIYLHVSPGRDTDRFYLLSGNAKVQMLVRASIAKNAVLPPAAPRPVAAKPGAASKSAAVPAKPATTPPAKSPAPSANSEQKAAEDDAKAAEPPSPEPAVLEDWWLIRDSQGRTGWILGSRVDVEVPDDVAQYAEGQRIIGAYVLAKVHDEEANTPNHIVSEYVTALSPAKTGLPFDFDQIRVFTWSTKRHRYETAFRLHPIQGFLPIRIGKATDAKGITDPTFSFQIAGSENLAIDPNTGIARPANPRTITYAMRDTSVRRIGPDMAPIPITHAPGEKSKSKPRPVKGKRRR